MADLRFAADRENAGAAAEYRRRAAGFPIKPTIARGSVTDQVTTRAGVSPGRSPKAADPASPDPASKPGSAASPKLTLRPARPSSPSSSRAAGDVDHRREHRGELEREPYYFLRVVDGHDFLKTEDCEEFFYVPDRRHADMYCSHIAPVIRAVAEKLTGRRHRMVFAGLFLPSEV